MEHSIRFARLEDAPALRQIYREYIHSGITFEYHLPSVAAFRQRIRETRRDYPYLVLLVDEQVVGFAYAHRFRQREAYQWSAELSIYLGRAVQGRGLGSLLYQQLMALLKLQRVQLAYALVTGANQGSLRFHERLGFTSLGIHPKAGYKAGQWLDMHWYQRQLGPQLACPAPFVPFHRLPLGEIRRVMRCRPNPGV